MPTKPVMFVACSREQLKLANAINFHLAKSAEIHIWEDDLRPKRQLLDGLVDEAKQSDFAIFICAPDDLVELRGGPSVLAPRDNVIFEAGLFLCELATPRCFLLMPAGVEVRLPDDIDKHEIAPLFYDSAARNARAAVRDVCTRIGEIITMLKSRRPRLWDDIADPEALRQALFSVHFAGERR